MNALFSHAVVPGAESGDRSDLRAAVTVPAPADHAWAGLTEHVHLWWPAGVLSRWGEDGFFDLEDNALVETSAQDDEYVWGEVTDGRPGHWLSLRWRHVGSDSVTQVLLELTTQPGSAAGDTTSPARIENGTDMPESVSALTLTHGGWSGADAQDLYDFYRAFWPKALAAYQRFMGGS
ncbi:hypothetical protein E8P82_06835 [Arthrobacter echini]|uniref:SRPBCC domain-containing protein n=1 Tax=Arthrobacter echini TaxID=1529066 RepID=A0A4S5E580_9MICC|nr:hypothetical protein [Arthrobacter echini]THJ66661.1 hypothetical protein E8P82_06835 [Arthrobacter echini]